MQLADGAGHFFLFDPVHHPHQNLAGIDVFDEELKKDRQAEIMELQQEIAFEKAQDAVGRTVLAMIEGKLPDEHAYVARTYMDAPGVDGLVFVQTSAELMTGDFVKVRITGSYEYDLIGEIVD